MKIGILVLIVFLSGCASTNNIARHLPITESNGSKTYLVTLIMSFYEELKTIGDGIMESRANQLCPTGYTILNQDAYKITDYGRYGTQVVWQIRCKNPEQAS